MLASTISDYLDQIAVSLRPNDDGTTNSDLLRFAAVRRRRASRRAMHPRHCPTSHRDLQARSLRRADACRNHPRPPPSRRTCGCCGCSSCGSPNGTGTTPPAVPIFMGDLPREDEPLPRFLDDGEFTQTDPRHPRRRRPVAPLARTVGPHRNACLEPRPRHRHAMVRIGDIHSG